MATIYGNLDKKDINIIDDKKDFKLQAGGFVREAIKPLKNDYFIKN